MTPRNESATSDTSTHQVQVPGVNEITWLTWEQWSNLTAPRWLPVADNPDYKYRVMDNSVAGYLVDDDSQQGAY